MESSRDVLSSMGFGVFGVRRIKMTPQELVVGNRSFATILLSVLIAGETVTSFTFLGAAGWTYARGAPAFYILAYFPATLIALFLLGPTIWRRARESNFLTNADYFGSIYQSRLLGLLVAICGVFFLVLYLTVQLTGIQILLEIAGYGSVQVVSTRAGRRSAAMKLFSRSSSVPPKSIFRDRSWVLRDGFYFQ